MERRTKPPFCDHKMSADGRRAQFPSRLSPFGGIEAFLDRYEGNSDGWNANLREPHKEKAPPTGRCLVIRICRV